jgi:SAM-dependent methyltransferase
VYLHHHDRERFEMSVEERSNSAEIFQQWSLYDRIIRLNYMKHREMAEGVARTAQMAGAACRVLDLGCGDGRMAAMGLEGTTCESYHGIDLSGEAIAAAKENLVLGDATIAFTQGDLVIAGSLLSDQWRHDRVKPVNTLLASYSLHHLPDDVVQNLLSALSSAMDRPGWFCWIDLCTYPDEARSTYLNRFYRDELTTWTELTPADVSAVIAHMNSSDFPLSESHRLEVAARAGFALHRPLYRDDFYAAHLFELPR